MSFPRSIAMALATVLLVLCVGCRGLNPEQEGPFHADGSKEEEGVKISQKCAAVILATTTAGTGLAAYAIAPAALCSAGFCATGVTGSSFASWWQSTLPLVAQGSLFAALQSVAMGGAGMEYIVVTGAAVGGAVSAGYLRDFCSYVDDPDSSMAPVFDGAFTAVTGAIGAADKVKTACDASETCTAAAKLASSVSTAVSEVVSSSVSSLLEGFWKGFNDPDGTVASNKTEAWNLKQEIQELKDQLRALNEETYGGWMFQKTRDYYRLHGVVDWILDDSSFQSTRNSVLDLESKILEKEARLIDIE